MKLINLNAQLDNPYFLAGKDEVFLYLELKTEKVERKVKRAPLNISLVIDRSGSMEGDNLNYVKKAVDFVIQNLDKNDYLSIVQYDDTVDVVSFSGLVTDKDALHRKVKAIVSGGMTNLSGGMLEGYNQVKTTQKDGFVNRVLLLSDGLANVGITEPSQLKEIARKQFQENRVGLSSFGVGAGFNEELMTQLSEHGGANYYFIETPDQIPQIFAQELSGLLSVVTQNTTLEIEFPEAYMQVDKAYGYLFQQTGNKVSFNFNDVFSEEEKAVVVKFKMKRPLDVSADFKVSLRYDDVVETMGKVTETETLKLLPTSDKALYEAAINKEAMENVVFFVSNEMFQEIMLLGDQRHFDKAKSKLESAIGYLKAYVEMFPASERLRNQLKEMENYLDRIPSMEVMERQDFAMSQKMSKSTNYMMQKRKM
jgi:Ca-activated chloride channel family protein